MVGRTLDMKCGSCKETGPDITVSHVKDCYAEAEYREWESKSEQAAELAVERFFEEGPHGPTPEDPREVHAQMMDDLHREAAQEAADIQAKEREEDEVAYAQKAKRDEELFAA